MNGIKDSQKYRFCRVVKEGSGLSIPLVLLFPLRMAINPLLSLLLESHPRVAGQFFIGFRPTIQPVKQTPSDTLPILCTFKMGFALIVDYSLINHPKDSISSRAFSMIFSIVMIVRPRPPVEPGSGTCNRKSACYPG
jgi:hypothetical protein